GDDAGRRHPPCRGDRTGDPQGSAAFGWPDRRARSTGGGPHRGFADRGVRVARAAEERRTTVRDEPGRLSRPRPARSGTRRKEGDERYGPKVSDREVSSRGRAGRGTAGRADRGDRGASPAPPWRGRRARGG